MRCAVGGARAVSYSWKFLSARFVPVPLVRNWRDGEIWVKTPAIIGIPWVFRDYSDRQTLVENRRQLLCIRDKERGTSVPQKPSDLAPKSHLVLCTPKSLLISCNSYARDAAYHHNSCCCYEASHRVWHELLNKYADTPRNMSDDAWSPTKYQCDTAVILMCPKRRHMRTIEE